MYGKMQASCLTEFTPFLCTLAIGIILFPCSPCFLHSPSSPTLGGDSIPWVPVLVALIHIWRPGITDGCDISCLLIWQDIFSSHTYYLITLCAKSLQSCLILCNYMNHSLPDSSVYGSLQARILEWVVIPFSRGSSWPRDQTLVSYVSCIGRQVLYL